MNDDTPSDCPRIEDISALLDGMLTGRSAEEIRAHAGQCPLCAAWLRDFSAMSTRLQTLRDIRCDVDLAALVARDFRRGRRPGASAPCATGANCGSWCRAGWVRPRRSLPGRIWECCWLRAAGPRCGRPQ